MRDWLGANAFLIAIILAGASLFWLVGVGIRALDLPPDAERVLFALALALAVIGAGVWGAIVHEKAERD